MSGRPLDRRPSRPLVTSDDWSGLRRHTAARIALGRVGASLPTREVLAFGLAHAQARDAVHTPLDAAALDAGLAVLGWPCVHVQSRAHDRAAYLARPDWGRRLNESSAQRLRGWAGNPVDVVFVISDGLSSTAVQRHALPLLQQLQPQLAGCSVGQLVVATQARVALADEVGELLAARCVVSVIGERPGLSSADSLGVYLTYEPRVGRNDGERNCISNIRPEGLGYEPAARLLAAMLMAALQARCSGVALRFDPDHALAAASGPGP